MGIQKSSMNFGIMAPGPKNLISDVPGVKVGHVTLADGPIQTGVTAIIPGSGSAFRDKFPAAVHVINGFGKSIGLMQIQELGTLETPILLTNTFSVGACFEGLLTYMLDSHPEIGTTTGTVNPVVTECNDSYLNDIRSRHVRPQDALQALQNAASTFEEGSVGAGRGMRCYGYKGGIGSASRTMMIDDTSYTVGALLLTNFGAKGDLIIQGKHISEELEGEADKGSCIIVLATDVPLSCQQLSRCARRAQNGLARTGSFTGNGSGEVVIMFSTANRIPHSSHSGICSGHYLHETGMDVLFRAVTECVEEGVISSLFHATTVTGIDGHTARALRSGLSER
ncbi:MAG: P1 family peptidase [Sphaerochaetaceae bacterium]|jgi:D-aminopeptidase